MFENEITRARMMDHEQTLAVLHRHVHQLPDRTSRLATARVTLAARMLRVRQVGLHRPAHLSVTTHRTRLSH